MKKKTLIGYIFYLRAIHIILGNEQYLKVMRNTIAFIGAGTFPRLTTKYKINYLCKIELKLH